MTRTHRGSSSLSLYYRSRSRRHSSEAGTRRCCQLDQLRCRGRLHYLDSSLSEHAYCFALFCLFLGEVFDGLEAASLGVNHGLQNLEHIRWIEVEDDDVIRKEISADDVFTEPMDLCGDGIDREECGGYMKRDGKVTFCTNPRHQQFSEREVPYDHCSYMGCESCPGLITQGIVISHCTCAIIGLYTRACSH
jgi:hypothetical protein